MRHPSAVDLVNAFTVTDPLAAEPEQGRTDAHLLSARRVLQARIEAAPLTTAAPVAVPLTAPSPWRRRLVVLAATATVLPVVTAVLVPAVTGRLGHDPTGGTLIATAHASETGLTCGNGYARAIPPDQADPRPFPNTLPTGWDVKNVFARSTSTNGWCTRPSLVAAHTDRNGLITGLIQIIGPARHVIVDGATGPAHPDGTYAKPTPDTIGGLSALSFPAPDLGGPQVHSWLITDPTGDQWYATTVGYPKEQGRELLAAATLNSPSVSWDAKQAPGLSVLSQRTGEPFPTSGTSQDWYLRLTIHGQPQDIHASQGDVLSQAYVGSRYLTIHGRLMKIQEDHGTPTNVYAQVLPGVVMDIEVHNNLDEATSMLASVQNLPADDPRLKQLALPENYTDHQSN